MAINYSIGNYVKFLRGTPTAYQQLALKDPDTLYFISERDADRGVLYLGDKLISGSLSAAMSLSDLSDVLIGAGVEAGSLLYFDGNKWTNKSLSEIFEIIIGEMVGATATRNGKSGLVPAPVAGQQNLYLQGNGTWSDPTAALSSQVSVLTGQVGTLIGNDTNKSVRDIAVEEVGKIVAGAPAAFDTLKEIADYLNDHPTESGFASRLIALENTVYTEDTGLVDQTAALVSTVGNLGDQINSINLTLDVHDEKITNLEETLKWRDFYAT